MAFLLAQRGIAVTLVEASRSFSRSFRGEGLMSSGLAALQQMGLAEILATLPHRSLDGWEFLINQRRLFQVAEPIEPGGQPCTLVSQRALLEALIERASQYSNFKLMTGTPVQDFLWQDDRVTGVRLGVSEDGATRELPAALVIGTDGRNSVVRQNANLAFVQQSQPFNILWFKLADFRSSANLELPTANHFYSIVHDRDAFGLFRSSEGGLQVGWALHDDDSIAWRQVDWPEQLATASPPWLAHHFRTHAATLEGPVLLTVVVGRCPQWSRPGVLLLGDAVHPMSPLRAQGINMALRDAIVAANHLVPVLQAQASLAAINAVLPEIQSEREPEIIRIQQLQAAEAMQAEHLRNNAPLRSMVQQFAPILRYPVRWSWLKRQRQLRQGVTQVALRV